MDLLDAGLQLGIGGFGMYLMYKLGRYATTQSLILYKADTKERQQLRKSIDHLAKEIRTLIIEVTKK
ncbi:MAG: hypothetical protein M1503_11490 [Thaumarchaeota archaeon]|nr:hypothetical protein [Nitrososphaerota archaeon]MCL5318866.1 hypothetical protein [Nitrososphaerota archaeon]